MGGSLRQALSLLLVFTLLGLTLWKLRRGGSLIPNRAAKKTRSLEAAERLALTPQHAIHLIRVHGREVLVATHPQGCTLIEHRAQAGAQS
jgi:flagellar biogenesis protein FliO